MANKLSPIPNGLIIPLKKLERQTMILRKRSLATALVLAVAASGAIVAPSFAAANAANTVTIWNGAETSAKDAQTPIIAAWAKTQGITINVVYKKDLRNEFIKAVPEG